MEPRTGIGASSKIFRITVGAALSLFSLPAFAAGPYQVQAGADGAKVLVDSDGKAVGKVRPVDPTAHFFHWAHPDRPNWIGARDFNEAVFAEKRNAWQGNIAGGGIYVSQSPMNSIDYGEVAEEVRMKAGTLVLSGFEPKEANQEFKQALSKELEKLGIGVWILGSEEGSLDWTVQEAWANILRYDAIESIQAMQLEAAYEAIFRNPEYKNRLQQLFELNEKMPLKVTPSLERNFPELADLIEGKITQRTRKFLHGKWPEFESQIKRGRVEDLSTINEIELDATKDLLRRVVPYFRAEIMSAVRTLGTAEPNDLLKQAVVDLRQTCNELLTRY